jgi:hypothetical protein
MEEVSLPIIGGGWAPATCSDAEAAEHQAKGGLILEDGAHGGLLFRGAIGQKARAVPIYQRLELFLSLILLYAVAVGAERLNITVDVLSAASYRVAVIELAAMTEIVGAQEMAVAAPWDAACVDVREICGAESVRGDAALRTAALRAVVDPPSAPLEEVFRGEIGALPCVDTIPIGGAIGSLLCVVVLPIGGVPGSCLRSAAFRVRGVAGTVLHPAAFRVRGAPNALSRAQTFHAAIANISFCDMPLRAWLSREVSLQPLRPRLFTADDLRHRHSSSLGARRLALVDGNVVGGARIHHRRNP